MDLIHFEIDEIVKTIKDKVAERRRQHRFEAWDPELKRDPDYWKDRGAITVADNVSLPNIEAICDLFGADFRKTKRGFLRLGGISHPILKDVLIWWPSEHSRQGWQNRLLDDDTMIVETHEKAERRHDQFNKHPVSTQIRYTFFHYKDVLGFTSYRFKGVFGYDPSGSSLDTGITWRRISDRISFERDSS